MKTTRPVEAKTKKGRGPKDIIDDYRRKFAKSLKTFSIEEINELKNLGRR